MPMIEGSNKRGVVLCKITIHLIKSMSAALFHAGHNSLSSNDIVMCCAICIGQLEGRPMTAAKIALYIGMPRPTVIRKIQRLESMRLANVDSRGLVSISEQLTDSRTGEVAQLVHKASKELSKMDG